MTTEPKCLPECKPVGYNDWDHAEGCPAFALCNASNAEAPKVDGILTNMRVSACGCPPNIHYQNCTYMERMGKAGKPAPAPEPKQGSEEPDFVAAQPEPGR